MTKQAQIERLIAEIEAAKIQHSWIVDQIAKGGTQPSLEAFEAQSLDELLDLQRKLVKMDVER